jgi:5-formyltetrahydrofolate cyclo-ligase
MTADKSELRRQARLRRAAAHRTDGAPAAAQLAEGVAAKAGLAFGATIAGYWPIGDEIDPRPLLATLAERGHRLALPVAIAKDRPLIFREWQAGDRLEEGPHGTHHPPAHALVLRPAILLVPLLAFDRRGFRLGQGGGYYDRTLAGLRAQGRAVRAIGLAFAAQEVAWLPDDPHDQRLDAVATEREWIEVKR